MAEDFNIRVMPSNDGIDDYLCTCPRGDFCKVVRKITGNVPYYEEIFEQLAAIYEEKKDWEFASDLYISVFKGFPGLENFKNLERAAKHLNDWALFEEIKSVTG